jgi:PhzF family phenazine biosynthesis protein
MRLFYRLVNVFTQAQQRATGNPLCVFEDGAGLASADMQALALQFNLSETTFILPSEHADARVRIFAPTYEMPFAGHPTLGSAHVLRQLTGAGQQVRLELNVGIVPVVATGDRWELRAGPSRARVPAASATSLAAALGLAPEDVLERPLWVDSGVEQLIVPLASVEAVRRARASYDALARVTADGRRPNAYVFAPSGTGTLLARYFFSKSEALLEDPATGSAAANLGGFYLARGVDLPLSLTIAQGEAVGRPSTLGLRIDADQHVFVAGEVMELGRGYVDW